MIEYPLIFLAGVAGSWHCVGMCGGFACALGPGPARRGAALARQLSYNLGRVTSYCFIGGLVGFLAAGLCAGGTAEPATSAVQRALAIGSGLLMVLIGLELARGIGPLPRLGWGGAGLAPALRATLRAPGAAAPLALGVFNGFLPCPLVYAFAAQAAGSGGALPGVLVMLAFGLGTFPALLLVAGLGDRLRHAGASWRWRRRSVDLAGALIVVLGMITVARGVVPLAVHPHAL